MSFPAGVETVLVRWGRGLLATGDGVTARLRITPMLGGASKVVWSASGDVLLPIEANRAATDDTDEQIAIPAVDQDGWVDGSGREFKGWSYKAVVTFKSAEGRTHQESTVFKVLAGQSEVDLDLLPSSAPGVPSAGAIAVVTSLAGLTGAVSEDDLAGLGVGGGVPVTVIDEKDAATLESAQEYTREQIEANPGGVSEEVVDQKIETAIDGIPAGVTEEAVDEKITAAVADIPTPDVDLATVDQKDSDVAQAAREAIEAATAALTLTDSVMWSAEGEPPAEWIAAVEALGKTPVRFRSTAEPEPEPTPVTATAPTFNDTAKSFTIPTVTGVEYRRNGTAVTGTVTVTAPTSVTITAHALSGYALTGTATWTHEFTATAQTYQAAVLADSPRLYLPLDDAAGTTNPRNLGSATSTVTVNGAANVTFGAAGLGDGATAVAINGTAGASIQATQTFMSGTTALTIEALVFLPSNSYILSSGGITANHVESNTGHAAVSGVTGFVSTPANTKTHRAMTWDGANIRVYNNGVLVKTEAAANPITTMTQALHVGARPGSASANGRIAGVAVYTKALTVDRLLAHTQAAGIA